MFSLSLSLSLEGTSAASLFSIYRGKNVLSFSPLLFSLRVILRDEKSTNASKSSSSIDARLCARVRVFCQYNRRAKVVRLSRTYICAAPRVQFCFPQVLVFRRLGCKTLN